MARILVVEDDETIAAAVSERLRSEGYEVVVAHDGPAGLEADERQPADLVVLDLMLPAIHGLEVCRRLQTRRPVPVIMLTARDDETDMLVGLALGADDYLTKPFRMRELVARVQSVLRRVERSRQAQPESMIQHGSLQLDEHRRQVLRDGIEVSLTATEFDLLMTLWKRGGAVLTREALLSDIWGYRDGFGARTIDSHIRSLRSKLGANVVRTVHGVGYGLGQA